MTKQEDTRRKSRRDLLLILLILPFGVLCMFMTGQSAIKLAPTWMLPVNMFSNLDPNAEFAGLDNPLFIEPLNPGILTQPVWDPLFLTPEAIIPTREAVAVISPPPPVRTPQPPPVEVNTPDNNPAPTATLPGGVILPTQPIPLLADLAITKTDNNNTYTPGTAINYTIVVTNQGPDEAYRFNVVDNIPAVISGLTVNCVPIARCGTNTSSGNTVSFINASLITGNQLTITIDGLVASGATGNLPNTAEVIVPPGSGYRDIFEASNIATDTDTQLSIYDLAITKSDGLDTYTAATTQFSYTILVTNSGPSDAIGIMITDPFPAGIASWDWTCTAVTNASRCNGVTGSTSIFSDTVNIQSGGSIEYTVVANRAAIVPPQNPQNISNTASVVIPSGPGVIIEQDSSNNSATDVNIPLIDLSIQKTSFDAPATYSAGGTVTYQVTAANNSTFNLMGITVLDLKPTAISTWDWTCLSLTNPTCTPSIGLTSDFTDTIDLAAGEIIQYDVTATIIGNPGDNIVGNLVNTATISVPSGLIDANSGDNSASFTHTSTAPAEVNIGPPDLSVYSPAAGTTSTFFLTPAITNDFVFYERDTGTGIAFDLVIIEISADGSIWTPVLNWGDDLDDTNSNVSLAIIGDGGNPLDPEFDDRPIPYANLFNNTGIAIDINSLGLTNPNGYPWIRFICPTAGNSDGVCDINSIQP